MSVSAPRRVGRYELLREIGRGGMAIVYVARQTDLDRDVALKELAAFHAQSPDFVERFLREARLAGSLSHPNIVTVHEYFELDGTAYIAMELIERGSLRPFVGVLDVPQIGGVLDGLLAGLAHAERRGVVHRDLKPENVMVTLEGSVKIADFGIAKALSGPNGRSLTGTGATVGTPAYIAPELALGGEIGPPTDLYAVGVIAYELLTGKVPFHETEMPLALMLRHANEPVPSLRSVRHDIDPELAAWVDRLLRKAPRERPSSAASASEELDEILSAVVGPRWRRNAALPDSPGGDGGPDTGPRATPVTRVLVRAWPPRRSKRRLAAVAVGLAAVGAGLLAWIGPGDHTRAGMRPKPVADLVPRPVDRLDLAAAGPSLFVADPKGRVVAVDRRSLEVTGRLANPARPRSAVVSRGSLLVADGTTLTALDPRSLTARGAVTVGADAMLAGGNGRDPVIARGRSGGGRVCTVGRGPRLGPCLSLPFAPSGLGVAPGGSTVYAADAGTGAVVVLHRTERGIERTGAPIPVGRAPHGRIVSGAASFVVPVERGVVIVDRATRSVTTVKFPVTPSDIWLSTSTGRLFAALPGMGRVGSIRLDRPGRPPLLVPAGDMPVALVGAPTGAVVYAVSAKDGDLTMLDRASGLPSGARRLPVLAAPSPRRLVLAQVHRGANEGIDVTLSLGGGTLPPAGVVVREATIADGHASFELWQGAIASRVGTRNLRDLTLRSKRLAGRLAIALTAPIGRYKGLRIRRQDGHTVRVTADRAPSPPVTSPAVRDGGTAPSVRPSAPSPPPTTPTPKKPTYDVG